MRTYNFENIPADKTLDKPDFLKSVQHYQIAPVAAHKPEEYVRALKDFQN